MVQRPPGSEEEEEEEEGEGVGPCCSGRDLPHVGAGSGGASPLRVGAALLPKKVRAPLGVGGCHARTRTQHTCSGVRARARVRVHLGCGRNPAHKQVGPAHTPTRLQPMQHARAWPHSASGAGCAGHQPAWSAPRLSTHTRARVHIVGTAPAAMPRVHARSTHAWHARMHPHRASHHTRVHA